jgi:integrase
MKKKGWSYMAGERGVNRVRVFEHWKTGKIFVEFSEHRAKRRKALGTRDRGAAKRFADEAAAKARRVDGGTGADANVEPHVKRWVDGLHGKVVADTINHYRNVVRQLIPDRGSFPASRLRAAILQPWLDGISGKPGTKRKYRAAVSSFCQYLVTVEILADNPVRNVKAPAASNPRMEYLEHGDVIRLIEAQDEPYRTLSALIHATGMEVSVAVSLKRRDVEKLVAGGYAIVARGTKSAARIRRVYVDTWAVPYLERHIATLTPDAELFPDMNRYTPSDKHREACKMLGITNYRLCDSRHTWAVRATRANASAEVVSRQLGHADTLMVNKVYARYRPNEEEMTAWHQRADERDKRVA